MLRVSFLIALFAITTMVAGCGGSSGPTNSIKDASPEERAAFKEQMAKEQKAADLEMEGVGDDG